MKAIFSAALVMAVLIFAGCPAAPPAEPMDQYKPYLAPGAVTSLSVTNGYEHEITLRWDASPNADEYQVWMIEASDYGASDIMVTGNTSFDRLKERGFKFLGMTSDTTYMMKDLPHNKAYVFSVIAMRDVGSETDSSVLYSDIGKFVEGSTVGDIAFAAVSLSDEVVLSWQVNNFYSVLPTVPGVKEPLFESHSFSVEYRRADEPSFTAINIEPGMSQMIYRMDYLDHGLQLNTDYIFRVTMSVMEGDSEISRVSSFEFPVHTSSDFTFSPVKDIKASQAKFKDAVELSWEAPNVPHGVELENVFEIQRAVYSEDPSALSWKTVLSAEDFSALGMPVPEDRVYLWLDDTVETNTRYLYRIFNGYVVEGNPVLQDKATPPATTTVPAFSVWRPENITLTGFVKEQVEEPAQPLSGTASFAWTLEEVPEGAKWVLRTDVWNADTFETVTTDTDIVPVRDGSSFTYEHEVSIEPEDSTHVSVFTFTLLYTYGDLASYALPVQGTNVSLGTTDKVELFSGLRASTDFVGQIILEWNVHESIFEENSYSIWIDDASDWAPIAGIINVGDGRRYVIDGVTGSHSYRLRLNGTVAETTPAYDYVCADTVIGNVLPAPDAPIVTDSTSRTEMTASWTVPAENIEYALEYREKGGTDWTGIEIVTADGSRALTVSDGFTAGTVYEFRLKAKNTDQNVWTEPSAIEEGSIFGPAGMDVKVVDNGLDPEKISLSWNPVIGADSYKIMRDGIILPGTVRGKNSYEDKSIIQIKPDESNPMPLSKEYSYSVIPYINDDEHSIDVPSSEAVTGKLFAPPANVTATKGTSTGVIKVSWDAVPEAEWYMIKPYGYGNDGIPVSKGPAIKVVGSTSYDYTSGNESLWFSVKAIRAGGSIESQFQNGFSSAKNFMDEAEDSNYGYKLRKPESFFTTEVIGADGFYAPYVTIKWQMVEGAETYWIKNSLHSGAEGLELDVRTLPYTSEAAVVTNGKASDEAGYLAYDKEKKEYIYNDNSGAFKDTSMITSYSISAMDVETGIITEDARDNTIVRRMLTHEEIVNFVNYILKPNVNGADKLFGGDWWAEPGSVNYDGQNGFTVTRFSKTWDSYWYYNENLMKMKDLHAEDFIFNTTVPIQYNVNSYSNGYLGTDPLVSIGRESVGTITVTAPSGLYPEFSVNYKTVGNDGLYTGKYGVIIGTSEPVIIQDSAAINRPF